MFSYFKPNFIEKFLGKVFFQILAKIEMMRNKNRLFGRHLEMVQHFHFFFFFFFFCRIVIFYSPYIYGGNFIAKFRWESGFLKGVPWNPHPPPLGHQREYKYLGHLSGSYRYCTVAYTAYFIRPTAYFPWCFPEVCPIWVKIWNILSSVSEWDITMEAYNNIH